MEPTRWRFRGDPLALGSRATSAWRVGFACAFLRSARLWTACAAGPERLVATPICAQVGCEKWHRNQRNSKWYTSFHVAGGSRSRISFTTLRLAADQAPIALVATSLVTKGFRCQP